MKNEYRVDGNVVWIKLNRRKRESVWTQIDKADFYIADSVPGSWGCTHGSGTDRLYVGTQVPATPRKQRFIALHRLLLKGHNNINVGTNTKVVVDHISNDPLDNRRSNLREVTRTINNVNQRRYKNNTSGIRGVSWHKHRKKWQANAQFEDKAYYLGLYATKSEAVIVIEQFWQKQDLLREYRTAA